MKPIRHIWFDFSDTLVFMNKETHTKLLHETFAGSVGKPITPELVDEYEALLQKHKSRSAVFTSLGHPSTFWADRLASVPPETLYKLSDKNIPSVLTTLREHVPISVFSNAHVRMLLPTLGVDMAWFTHVLGPDAFKAPKPALEGFHKMIELSGVPPGTILYIGDSVEKDVLPAKEVGILAGLIWSTSPEADYCFKSFKEILDVVH